MRRLIVDCQILQTSAFDRGMGKYTLSVLRSFLKRQNRYEKIEILLSGNLNTTKERLEYIKDFLGSDSLIILDIPTDISSKLQEKYSQAETVVSNYIDATKKATVSTDFLITSPFFVGFPAIFPIQDNVGKFAIIYDIIPVKIWQKLRIFPDEIYFNHFKIFFKADRLFTISHAVRNDLNEIIGIDKARIVPIDGGPFKKPPKAKRRKLDLKKPYILYPSAPIVHKNNESAVRAFELFNKASDYKYHLYITSTFDEEYREKLQSEAKQVLFTGNITDEELAYAYSNAEALYFPSLSEGLGMPVLEAVQYGLPVACSNIPVLTEMSETAFYQFDPVNESQMAKALSYAVKRKNWSEKLEQYKVITSEYTWENAAEKLFSGLRVDSKRKSVSLELIIPNPKSATPAGMFGELFYGFASPSWQIKVTMPTVYKAKRASYLAHVSVPGSDRVKIFIKDQSAVRSFFSRKTKVKLIIKNKNKKQQIILTAHRVFKDNAVQLEGWELFTQDNQIFTPARLIRMLSK